ncbi:hypothetical protein PanWU01x14_166800 [Parasponia andersonii]|uniref:Uncharacterized protein n=1 Tax=Parasponia andersonii TaxID=3476 RepID=A0A2P5CBR1_PARAD|nr:hypothetical protein PanWU01x14_166800 [Parasponia andersonii]
MPTKEETQINFLLLFLKSPSKKIKRSVQDKCASILKKKGRATVETLSDDEEVDHMSNFMAFVANSQT